MFVYVQGGGDDRATAVGQSWRKPVSHRPILLNSSENWTRLVKYSIIFTFCTLVKLKKNTSKMTFGFEFRLVSENVFGTN